MDKIDLSKLRWIQNAEFPHETNGMIDGKMVAWITKRPNYCDRGHWQLNIDLPLDLDEQDGFPRYYMEFATTKKEAELFLDWRVNKIRAE